MFSSFGAKVIKNERKAKYLCYFFTYCSKKGLYSQNICLYSFLSLPLNDTFLGAPARISSNIFGNSLTYSYLCAMILKNHPLGLGPCVARRKPSYSTLILWQSASYQIAEAPEVCSNHKIRNT